MATKTKQDKFLVALQNGSEISTNQAISRFGFEGPNAVSSAVRNLRENGHPVYSNKVNGVTKYRVGTPTRAVIAAGYQVLGSSAYTR